MVLMKLIYSKAYWRAGIPTSILDKLQPVTTSPWYSGDEAKEFLLHCIGCWALSTGLGKCIEND